MKPTMESGIDLIYINGITLLPKWEEIPDEYKKFNSDKTKLFSRWFYGGLPEGTVFVPKKGIDKKQALRHIHAAMTSWDARHEHKEAGVSYLLDQWFDKIIIPK